MDGRAGGGGGGGVHVHLRNGRESSCNVMLNQRKMDAGQHQSQIESGAGDEA